MLGPLGHWSPNGFKLIPLWVPLLGMLLGIALPVLAWWFL